MRRDAIAGRHRRESAGGLLRYWILTAGRFSLAAVLALLFLPAAAGTAKPSSTPFSVEPGSFKVIPSTAKAGAHPDLTIAFAFAHSENGSPFNDVKDMVISLPPGVAGAAAVMSTCTNAQLVTDDFSADCPLASQVGTVSLDFTLGGSAPSTITAPLFNMEHGPGTSAMFGFKAFFLSQLVPMSIRPDDGGLTAKVQEVPLAAGLRRASVTLWGAPALPSHDAQRGQECTDESCSGGGNPAGVPPRAFLDNPTRCGAASAKLEARSWEEPEIWSKAEAEVGPIAECGQVPFQPSVEVQATSETTESPTGLDLSILVPQSQGNPESVMSSSLAGVAIDLPEGFSVNPVGVSAVCTQEEFERETTAAASDVDCPPGSKLGAVEIQTPLLPEAAVGSIYMAKPFDNLRGSLFALYVAARTPASGGLVRLSGRLLPDPSTGRLHLSFDNLPALPLSRLTLRFPQRTDSLLVTPPACGSYAAKVELTPSSDPITPRQRSDRIAISRGPGGGPCPSADGLPFHPHLTARSLNEAAGVFSRFYLSLRREDGEAQLADLSLRLPPGMVADLAATSRCPAAALAAAEKKLGAEERVEPSCPASSEIGKTQVSLGVGSKLARVPGLVYLAGGYHGAALSLAVVTPALLGPFDLGTVVVRSALRVDRKTAEIVIDSRRSDPIPKLLSGIPMRLREVGIYLDRGRFLRNPTSCKPLSVEGTVTSVKLSAPFRAAACDKLRFAPRLRLRLRGGVHRNGHPALRIALDSGAREAGLADATIDLPRTALLDPGRIDEICVPRRLREGRCPADSAYGFARVSTPFLAEPLKGPVYLLATKHGLPSLIAALHNREMDFDLTAGLDAVRGGLRIALQGVPDLPISKLVLEMKGGRGGLLVNSVDFCTDRQRAVAKLTAHNGKRHDLKPRLLASCRPTSQNDHADRLALRRQRAS